MIWWIMYYNGIGNAYYYRDKPSAMKEYIRLVFAENEYPELIEDDYGKTKKIWKRERVVAYCDDPLPF